MLLDTKPGDDDGLKMCWVYGMQVEKRSGLGESHLTFIPAAEDGESELMSLMDIIPLSGILTCFSYPQSQSGANSVCEMQVEELQSLLEKYLAATTA